MTIDQGKQVVHRFVREVFVEGRTESLDALVSDDFVSHTWGPTGSGKEDLKHAMARLADALADVEFVIDDTIAEGDLVAVRLTASATQVGEFMARPPRGRRYTIGEMHFFRIRDGRIVEHWHQYDQAGMLRQLDAQGPGQ